VIERFRVATRASGTRRQIFIHVYDDREELAREHTKARNMEYDPNADIAGGVVTQQGYPWPKPDYTPIIVMRLWTGQLTTKTVAHEAVHAAAPLYFMDGIPGWHSRARAHLIGDHEMLAYLVGDIASEVIRNLYKLNLLVR
jgi:hypothetical protein